MILFIAITSILVNIVFLSIFLLDVVLYVCTRTRNAQMADNKSYEAWIQNVRTVSKKWLYSPPVVSLSGNNRLVILDMLNGHYRHKAVQAWQVSGLIMGLSEGCGADFVNAEEFINKQRRESVLYVEDAFLLYSLFRNQEKKYIENYESDITRVYMYIISQIKNSYVTYRSNMDNLILVDTLAFICPFLALYGSLFNKPEAINMAVQHILKFDEGIINKFKLPPHAYDIDKEIPLGAIDWGRGNGWYILAIVETFRVLNKYVQSHKFISYLRARIEELASQLSELQSETGGFNELFLGARKDVESSGTVCIGILFLEAYKLTGHSKYFNALKLIIKSLKSNTNDRGVLLSCQGDNHGVGLYTTKKGKMPFAQGMLFLLISRCIKDVPSVFE